MTRNSVPEGGPNYTPELIFRGEYEPCGATLAFADPAEF